MALYIVEKPPLIVPGTVGWFHAPSTATGSVASWTNLANSQATATAAGSAQPTATANQIGTKTGLVFNGSANLLTLSSQFYNIPNGANSIICVAKRNVASGNQAIINMNVGASPSNQAYRLQYANTAGNILYQNRGLDTSAVTSTGNTTTNFNIIQADFDGSTTINIRINNGAATTNTNSLPVSSVNGAAIGGTDEGTNLWAGVLMELIIAKGQWTAAQRLYLARYLSNEYGIAIA